MVIYSCTFDICDTLLVSALLFLWGTKVIVLCFNKRCVMNILTKRQLYFASLKVYLIHVSSFSNFEYRVGRGAYLTQNLSRVVSMPKIFACSNGLKYLLSDFLYFKCKT